MLLRLCVGIPTNHLCNFLILFSWSLPACMNFLASAFRFSELSLLIFDSMWWGVLKVYAFTACIFFALNFYLCQIPISHGSRSSVLFKALLFCISELYLAILNTCLSSSTLLSFSMHLYSKSFTFTHLLNFICCFFCKLVHCTLLGLLLCALSCF